MLIGPLLADARRRVGWSQRQLAERSGVREEHISRIERGTVPNPGVNTLRRLSAALELSPEYFVVGPGAEDAFTRMAELNRYFLEVDAPTQRLLVQNARRMATGRVEG